MFPEGWQQSTIGEILCEHEYRCENRTDLMALSLTKAKGLVLAKERFGRAPGESAKLVLNPGNLTWCHPSFERVSLRDVAFPHYPDNSIALFDKTLARQG
jgi:hypothetical protein